MNDDVFRMQQEAAQRVQQMQERSRQIMNESESMRRTTASLAAARPDSPLKEKMPVSLPPPPHPPASHEKGIGGLADLFHDEERLLLLLLTVLLVKNGAELELVVALLYLAM